MTHGKMFVREKREKKESWIDGTYKKRKGKELKILPPFPYRSMRPTHVVQLISHSLSSILARREGKEVLF